MVLRKRLIVLLISFVLFCSTAWAETITLDLTGWTQTEKNMIRAMAYSLAWEDDNRHGAPEVRGNKITFATTVGDVVTGPKIRAKWASQVIIMEQEAVIERDARNVKRLSIKNRLDAQGWSSDEIRFLFPMLLDSD